MPLRKLLLTIRVYLIRLAGLNDLWYLYICKVRKWQAYLGLANGMFVSSPEPHLHLFLTLLLFTFKATWPYSVHSMV